MEFVQIMKLSTAGFDELEAAHQEWMRATEGERTVVRETVCENRDRPGEYWLIVEFPSFEAAMRNNELPATARIAEQLSALSDGEPEFVNLDVRRRD
jgi:quinol monooxygenase YgiN